MIPPMWILAIVLGIVLAFVAFAPKHATQMALAGVWALGAVWVVGMIVYALSRLLFS